MAELVQIHIENFCAIERATVYLRRQGMVLITGDNQDTQAADNNGAGKSTVFKALTWCLFGDTLDGDKLDEVIRYETKRADVSVLFEHGGAQWVVRRWREKAKPGLELGTLKAKKKRPRAGPYEPEVPWDGPPKEVQPKIVELLGKDFRAFCNTSLFGQGDNKRFFSATDQAMKDTLHRILRSDIYRRAEVRLRETRAKRAAADVSRLENEVETVESRIEEHDVETIQREHDEWREERAGLIAAETQEAKDLVARAKEVDVEAEEERAGLEARVGALRSAVVELERTEAAVVEADAEAAGLEPKAAANRERHAELSAEARSASESLDLLAGDKCPTCTASLSKGAPAKHIKSLKEKHARLEDQAASLETEHGRLVGEIRKARERADALRLEVRNAGDVRGELAEREAELERLDADAAAERRSLAEQAKAKVARVKELQSEENPHAAALSTARDRVLKLRAELGEKKKELEERRSDLAHFEFWLRGFGPRGLPSLLLDSTMPYVTERTNVHLLTLADGDITVEFDTQRELKSKKGEKRDEITKTCTIEGVPGATPSDGQKKKLEIASDMALMDLAETREGGSGLLMMDEVLDGLDAEGEARVMRLLRDLRSKNSSIFVVTHEPGLAQSFERQLHVVKRDKAATIEEVK